MKWENYQDLLSWMPLVIGLHTAVPLLVSGTSLRLFVPNLDLPENFLGAVLGLAEISIALSFFYGALTRFGALALAGTWLAGAILFGPVRLLEHGLLLGIAFFLFVTGRGPVAFDMALERLHRPIERFMPYAVPVLRISTGASIAVLAFTEKIWNMPMGLAFLEAHQFNFFPALGLESIGNREFLLIAGTVELTFGLLLMSGVFVRLLILALWVPFNLTLPLLGWSELVGHLPDLWHLGPSAHLGRRTARIGAGAGGGGRGTCREFWTHEGRAVTWRQARPVTWWYLRRSEPHGWTGRMDREFWRQRLHGAGGGPPAGPAARHRP